MPPLDFLKPKRPASGRAAAAPPGSIVQQAWRVGVAVDSGDLAVDRADLEKAFREAVFDFAEGVAPQELARRSDVVVTGVDARDAMALDDLRAWARAASGVQVVVALRNADLTTTRRLLREGFADVLAVPVADAALASSLERVLSTARRADASGAGRARKLIAVLKAGGGVGATTIAAQTAAILARGTPDATQIGLADLDLQSGLAANYLDMPDAFTVADVLNAGVPVAELPLATSLARHKTGLRVLAAPGDLTPLEAMSAEDADGLAAALKRDFHASLIDLPPVWTAWSYRLLQQVDRIVLVTRLTVPHVDLVRRQLRMLANQGLEDTPLTLVCNFVGADSDSGVTQGAAERAIERSFDVMVPEDRKLFSAAANQGLCLDEVRRGTKAEKALETLAGLIAAPVAADAKRG